MDILFLLVPLSVLLALAVMGVLAWAVWSGQFEELDSEGERILVGDAPEDALQSDKPSSASLIHINTPNGSGQHTSA
jgi:cbb3-type cytochrome oxidase maturation protein